MTEGSINKNWCWTTLTRHSLIQNGHIFIISTAVTSTHHRVRRRRHLYLSIVRQPRRRLPLSTPADPRLSLVHRLQTVPRCRWRSVPTASGDVQRRSTTRASFSFWSASSSLAPGWTRPSRRSSTSACGLRATGSGWRASCQSASRPNWLVASRRSKHGIEAIRGDRRPPHWPSGGHTAATKPHCVNSWQLSGDVIYSRKLGS